VCIFARGVPPKCTLWIWTTTVLDGLCGDRRDDVRRRVMLVGKCEPLQAGAICSAWPGPKASLRRKCACERECAVCHAHVVGLAP
jgi:hypothetical protein